MSLWPVVLSLLLGVMAAAFVPLSLCWILCLLAVSLSLLAYFYFREWKFELLFLLCCALVGWSDTLFHQCCLGEQIVLPSQKSYRAPSLPSAAVIELEACLEQSSLSEEHRLELNAMMFGDRTTLSSERRSMFRLAGAQHLLALSGTHLGILVAICYFVFLYRVRYTRLYWPMLVGVLSFLWFYTLMVGAPNSLRRAMLMTTLFLIGNATYRTTHGDEILASTVFLMLLFDPLCVFDIGAELSVAAVTGIIFLFPQFYGVIPSVPAKEQRRWTALSRIGYGFLRWMWGLFAVSLSAWLLTMPLVLFHFGQIQPWQILTGVVLVPATMFILYVAVFVLFVCFVGWSPLTCFCSGILDRMMDWHDWLLVRCGELPYSLVRTSSISLMQMLVLYAIMLNIWYAWTYRTRRNIYLSFFYVALLLTILIFF